MLLRFAVGLPSDDDAVLPKPRKSRTPAAVAQPVEQLSAVVEVTSATLPAVEDSAIVPMTSGAGSGVPLAPVASPTSR